MSMEAVWEFRKKADADVSLADEIRAALADGKGLAGVAAVAQQHGFEVTSEEVEQGWAEVSGGELSALELELVSAGNLRENKANSVHYS